MSYYGHFGAIGVDGTRAALTVERKTRFVILCRMDGCTARDALDGFTRQMKKLPAFLRESLTYDRGTEMACHVELSRRLNIDIWFADPHSPWQRGSNENTNGLLRQFLPKGMDDLVRPSAGTPPKKQWQRKWKKPV
jgi:IS30 family transposase